MGIAPHIRAFKEEDYLACTAIYKKGMDTGVATFETQVPSWKNWDHKFIKECRLIAESDGLVLGWCALTPFSSRQVYRGVAEVTIYVDTKHQGLGIGKMLLERLIVESEAQGFWTLQAKIFPENTGSVKLHQALGFRQVGIREKLGKRDGKWYDNILFERRSKKTTMKNILVLCTGNSCRSQMADGYLRRMAGEQANIYSAGIETHGLNPGAVATMAKDGIDITGHTSNHVDEYQGVDWDFIITVCDHAHENCPFIAAPNAKRLHHNFYDPSKFEGTAVETEAAFAKARDEIKNYCRDFVQTNLS